MTAACMSPAEAEMWNEANDRLEPESRSDGPCRDCPMAFALEMRAAGCCNGEPGRTGRAVRLTGDYGVDRLRAQWRAASSRRYAARKVARETVA